MTELEIEIIKLITEIRVTNKQALNEIKDILDGEV